MIVAVGKYAEKRANLAVAGTELKGKIKVTTLHLCKYKSVQYRTKYRKGRKIKRSSCPMILDNYITFEIPHSVPGLFCVVSKVLCYTSHILSRVRRLSPPSSE
jgi:hypothetical protein